MTQVQNNINGAVISQYDYVNDAAGRRTAITRSGSMMSETRTDYYDYNDRSELTNAVKNATLNEYAYQYDDIGNRLSSLDLGTNRTYTANELNQYTNIVDGVDGFLPEFDLDGNQTLIKTATGVWQVSYNGENRPVLWECGSTNITMKFDRMGRRVEYVEMVSGVTNTHHRFVYDGYLCIQRLNALANNSIDLVFGWDPSEQVATRPLILQKYGAYSLFYTHDGNKNVSDLVFFQQANGIAAHYEYAPFGSVTAASRSTPVTAYDFREYNPFRFSSEYTDDITDLTYYNYRHYNSKAGRWKTRDPIGELNNLCLYGFIRNHANLTIDKYGLMEVSEGGERIRQTVTFKNGEYERRVSPYFVEVLDKFSTYEFYLVVSGKCKNNQGDIGDPEVTVGEETGHNLVNEPDNPAIALGVVGYSVSWRLSRSDSSVTTETCSNGKKCKVNKHTVVWHLYRETSISLAIGIGPFSSGLGIGGLFPDSREVANLREEFTKTCCCED